MSLTFFLIRNRNSLLSRNNPDNEQYSATSVSGFGLEAGRRVPGTVAWELSWCSAVQYLRSKTYIVLRFFF